MNKYLNSILSKEPTAQPYLGPKLAMTPQPIETASKESGNRLLLFDTDWFIGWWHPKWGWTTECTEGMFQINPTHWLPIPDRPS